MTSESKKGPALFKKRDLIIFFAILISMGLLTLWIYYIHPALNQKTEIAYAWIYHDNTLLEKVALDGTERTWVLEIPSEGTDHEGAEIRLETFADRSIAVKSSSCPDKICVHTGRVSQIGQSIACLPNHVIIKIGNKDWALGESKDQ